MVKFGRGLRGFTIIEVMIVLAISVAILSVVFIAIPQLQNNHRRSEAYKGMDLIVTMIENAHQAKKRYLKDITGSGCSDCACRPPATMETPGCITNWERALARISVAAFTDINHLTRDPWGNPYALDENEGESGYLDCRPDSLRSAGTDGIWNTTDDLTRPVPRLRTVCP